MQINSLSGATRLKLVHIQLIVANGQHFCRGYAQYRMHPGGSYFHEWDQNKTAQGNPGVRHV
jgi:hypothetical protein